MVLLSKGEKNWWTLRRERTAGRKLPNQVLAFPSSRGVPAQAVRYVGRILKKNKSEGQSLGDHAVMRCTEESLSGWAARIMWKGGDVGKQKTDTDV